MSRAIVPKLVKALEGKVSEEYRVLWGAWLWLVRSWCSTFGFHLLLCTFPNRLLLASGVVRIRAIWVLTKLALLLLERRGLLIEGNWLSHCREEVTVVKVLRLLRSSSSKGVKDLDVISKSDLCKIEDADGCQKAEEGLAAERLLLSRNNWDILKACE